MKKLQNPAKCLETDVENRSDDNGFTLMEILIALSIFAVGILAVATMQIRAIQVNSLASNISESSTWAQDKMEELITRPWDHGDLASGNNPHSNTLPDGTVVTWNINDMDIGGAAGPDIKQIALTSTYRDDLGRTKIVNISGAYSRVGVPGS